MRNSVPVAGTVRLDRALSKLGLASRSEARKLIEAGEVRVRGRTARDPSLLVTPEAAHITVAGRRAEVAAWRTIAMNKPRGVVTTRRDPEGRRTVFDVLAADARPLVAVGRLDLASTGLLILTTDTQLAHWLTSPASQVIRRYVVTARGFVTDESVRRIEAGIDDLRAHSVRIQKRSRRETHMIVALTEGKNREIRRLLEAEGHEVTRLLRIAFGGIELGSLQPGEWREISRAEIAAAIPGCALADERRREETRD